MKKFILMAAMILPCVFASAATSKKVAPNANPSIELTSNMVLGQTADEVGEAIYLGVYDVYVDGVYIGTYHVFLVIN